MPTLSSPYNFVILNLNFENGLTQLVVLTFPFLRTSSGTLWWRSFSSSSQLLELELTSFLYIRHVVWNSLWVCLSKTVRRQCTFLRWSGYLCLGYYSSSYFTLQTYHSRKLLNRI
jgi:hypothetical protein